MESTFIDLALGRDASHTFAQPFHWPSLTHEVRGQTNDMRGGHALNARADSQRASHRHLSGSVLTVPEIVSIVLPIQVLVISTPGAKMSTIGP